MPRGGRRASQYVDTMRYGFQVFRVDAGDHAAQVVDIETFGQLALRPQVRDAMCPVGIFVKAELSVATRSRSGCPEPARPQVGAVGRYWPVLVNLGPESLFARQPRQRLPIVAYLPLPMVLLAQTSAIVLPRAALDRARLRHVITAFSVVRRPPCVSACGGRLRGLIISFSVRLGVFSSHFVRCLTGHPIQADPRHRLAWPCAPWDAHGAPIPSERPPSIIQTRGSLRVPAAAVHAPSQ
jgi:hypothetical protein